METVDVKELSVKDLEKLLAEKKAAENAVELEKRDSYEKLKEDTVCDLVNAALIMQEGLSVFKNKVFGDVKAVYELLKEYSNRKEDDKGNFQLVSADGSKKLQFSRSDSGFFDERSKQAEKHIIEFVESQFASDEATQDLISSLLERKKGHLDIKLVQKLYAMEDRFESDNWKQGLKLLKESWQTGDSKFYVNFYVRNENDEWKHVNINFSSL
jgi:hypothetical protein